MTPEQFQQWADLLPEPMLLLDGEGTILAANASASGKLAPISRVGRRLCEVAANPHAGLAEYLRACSRSRSPLPGAIILPPGEGEAAVLRCEGALLDTCAGGAERQILLRLVPKESAVRQFLALNQKLDELAAAPPAALGNVPSRRILVVDDNVGAAKMLALLLTRISDHQVHTAHDGLSALEAARDHRPEIVLLDIGLPRMNGYEVARRLRQRPEFEQTVLVALTGYGSEDDRRRSIEAGFDEHLVKPPSLESLQRLAVHHRLVST